MSIRIPRNQALLGALLTSLTVLSCETETSQAPPVDRKKGRLEAEARAALDVRYVGSEKCASCHVEQAQSVIGSRHDESLRTPGEKKVRAPFAGETISGAAVGATFRGGPTAPVIDSDKPRPVKWSLGDLPYQQYVVETAKGRHQVFPASYDGRRKHLGGRRWFLTEGSDVEEGDGEHWHGAASNFDSSCVSCHATNVKKNYALDGDTYDAQLGETHVACEACHGPGSRHVALAATDREKWPASVKHAGFNRALSSYTDRRWFRAQDEDSASLQGDGAAPPARTDEVSSCAPCHSKREDHGQAGDTRAELPFDERYLLNLVETPNYHDNGRAAGEVYEYGSFVQSSMYRAGVICSDCHDPHSTVLREPPQKLCLSCHSPEKFEANTHTFHPASTVECVDCHMPERTVREVGKRRDHHFSIPRPDLSLDNDAPHACQNCHSSEGSKWAALAIKHTHGEKRPASFAAAFFAATSRSPKAPPLLLEVVADKQESDIIRASALSRWAELRGLGKESDFEDWTKRFAKSKKPLFRLTAIRASYSLKDDVSLALLGSLLGDTNRVIRSESARQLLGKKRPKALKKQFETALKDTRATAEYRADRADGLLLLAAIEEFEGNVERTFELYDLVAERFGASPELHLARASTLDALLRTEDAEKLVAQAVLEFPSSPALLHQRGMTLLRKKNLEAALPLLQGAFEQAPGYDRRSFGYAYAVALHEKRDWAEAISVLRLLVLEFPSAKELKHALKLYRSQRDSR